MRTFDRKERVVSVMHNVLVPLDGSPLAEAALPFASAIAARAGASLTLVYAAVYRTLFVDVAVEQLHVIKSGEDYLARMATDLRMKGVPVNTRVPLGGSPADWIVEETEFCHADLIVMATHGREGPDRWLHGSVAEAVVHRSKVPVMLVSGTPDTSLPQRFEAHEPILLVPLDGSELADSVLPIAGKLARATGARIVLVAVVPKPGQLIAGQGGAIVTYTASEDAAIEAAALAHLQAGAGRISDVTSVDTVVRYGDAADEIGVAAEQYAAAAVVMATHGRTGSLRSMLGSVAGRLVHGATVPVVVIHPTEVLASAEPVPHPAVAGSAN